ncbi:hypothetical protein KBC55_02000 [Patescibacteria group bacterium]|nr:hypothetical protein [Patescibacteria group bacterium]
MVFIDKRKPRKFTGLTGVNHLLTGAMGRHGIMKRVETSQIVREAEVLLTELSAAPQTEWRVASYVEGTLTIACASPAVVEVVDAVGEALARALEESFPHITVTVLPRFSPKEARQGYTGDVGV